ncbi:MAG: PAS domain-containing protein [Planctomycetes bacterium]|nr:PAS domain-containing protein [Planctomycetota bacterium]
MPMLPLRVLIIEDNPSDAELILHSLQQAGFEPKVIRAETEVEYLTQLESAPDVILCDYNLPQLSAMRALDLLQERRLEIPFLIVSGSIGEETAVESIKRGATDYILKDRLGRLGSAVTRALEQRKLRDAERSSQAQLRFQNALLECQTEASPDGILVVGPDNQILSYNRRFLELWDIPPELAKAGDDTPVLALARSRTADPDAFVARVEAIYADPDTQTNEEVALADGRTLDRYSAPIRGTSGELLGRVWFFRDITNRKRAESEVQRQQKELQLIFDMVPAVIFFKDRDHRLVRVNDELVRLVGLPRERLEGRTDVELGSPQAAQYYRDENEVMTTGRPKRGIIEPIETATGTRWLQTDKLPHRDATGQIIGVIGFAIDITNRKQAEELFRQAQERLQHVIASSPAILFSLVIEADHIRGIAWMSENVRDVLGYSPAETCGTSWWMANMHPEDRDRVMSSTDQGLIAKGRVTHEYRFKHRNGQYRWLRSEIRLVLDATGESVEAIGSWSDITERQLLEEQYRQAQKMEAFGQLSAGIAHDFNNLLTVINGYSDLLIDEFSPTDPQRISAIEIREAGGRAAALTAQLLAFSRRTIVEPKIFDLNELVDRVVKMLRRLIGEDIILVTELSPTLSRVKADQSQMEQLIMNLAVNARDAMPKGGRLTIGTQNTEALSLATLATPNQIPSRHVRITVSDTGTGMTDEVKAKLFEPFFTTKGVGKGTGLGLATVFGIVKQAGGQIDVTSEVGVGTIFTVLLPAASDTTIKPPSGKLGIPKLGSETDDAIVRHGVVEETDAFLQKPFTPLALARKVRGVLDGSE